MIIPVNAAEIVDGKVTRIIVALSTEWCQRNLGGEWVDVTYKSCGRGYDYIDGEFRPPQPYDSWTWYDGRWNAPVEMPDGDYIWDEDNLEWVEMDTESEGV